MKIKNKVLIIFFIFALLLSGSAFCAEGAEGIDITELRKLRNIKSIFKRTPKQKKTLKQQEIQQEENEPSLESPFLDGSADEIFPTYSDFSKKTQQETEIQEQKPKKVKKEKRRFLDLFKKKNKDNDDIENQDIIEQDDNNEAFDNNHTYINDTDIVYIKEIEVFGNNLLDVNFIKEQLHSKAGERYVRSEVSNDLKALYSTGYFSRNLRALPIKIDDTNIKLRIIVEENPPVKGFLVVGNDSIATAEIMNILTKYEGKPQNILNINNAISEIQDLYSSRGYILARVSKVQDDPDGYINVLIDEGIIGDIIVEGNNKTRDFIVKRNILQQPGTVYNENIMRSDILRLMGTAAFKDVQREIKQDENTGLYDVYIALEEQRTGKISLGVGIDSASGFFGSVGFGENNFRGLGQKLNLNFMAGTGVLMNDSSVVDKPNFQGEISFLEPYFKNENQSLGIRAFARYFGSYQVPLAIERRFGGEITLARRFITYKNLSGSIGFGAEHVHLSEGDENTIRYKYAQHNIPWSERKKEMDSGLYVKITPALTYDTRDSSVNPRRGLIAKISFDENIGIGAKTFGKLHGMVRKFIPVGRKSSFVVTARAGGKIHGRVPEFAGFALGGPYTIRGFNVSEVGVGNGYMMGSAEYRLPIPFIDRLTSNNFLNNIRLAAFMDAGTLFNKTSGTRAYGKPGYAISAGVGIRIFIPGLGPINLDYGIPLTNTGEIHRKHGFFTFGMGEMF